MANFEEIAFRNQFKKCIEEIFAENYDTINSAVEVFTENDQEPTYPCCLISILNPLSADRHSDSDGTYNFIDFTLNCELYSMQLDDYSKKDAIIKLSQILINGILSKFGTFSVTRNQDVPFQSNVARRVVSFAGTLDTNKNIIYNN